MRRSSCSCTFRRRLASRCGRSFVGSTRAQVEASMCRTSSPSPITIGRRVDELVERRPPGLEVAHGHMLFVPDRWPRDARFVTILRDPVERTISHYYWLKRETRARSALGSIEEAIGQGEIRDNLQVRVLAGADPSGPVTSTMAEEAIAALDRFTAVGLTERFDESLVLLRSGVRLADRGVRAGELHEQPMRPRRARRCDASSGSRSTTGTTSSCTPSPPNGSTSSCWPSPTTSSSKSTSCAPPLLGLRSTRHGLNSRSCCRPKAWTPAPCSSPQKPLGWRRSSTGSDCAPRIARSSPPVGAAIESARTRRVRGPECGWGAARGAGPHR